MDMDDGSGAVVDDRLKRDEAGGGEQNMKFQVGVMRWF